MGRWTLIAILGIAIGVWLGLAVVGCDHGKKVVYSLEERDARLQKTFWSLFEGQK